MKPLSKAFLHFIMVFLADVCYPQQDTLKYDPASGNYIIQYVGHLLYIRGLDGTLRHYGDTELQDGEELVEKDSMITVTFEPATKINPKVECVVTRDTQRNMYVFSYNIENGSDSKQNLDGFVLEFGGIDVTDKTGPDGWHSVRQRNLDGSLANRWSWRGDIAGIDPPPSPEDGFKLDNLAALESPGLPGIMNAYFRGHAPILAFPTEAPGGRLRSQIAALRVFPADHVVRKTVSPVAPPSHFVAFDFLDTLISFTTQSRSLGWITNQPAAGKYEGHFTAAQTNLQQADINAARVSLNTVLSEGAQDSATALTSEAYALLRYNTEYLLDQLPGQGSIAVLATHSLWLEQNAEILSGSVVVNESGDPPFLDSQVALSVGIGSAIPAGYDLKASSIKIKQNATVAGNVYYNELTNNGTITGTLNTPLSLPVVPTLPPFQTATPGTEDLTLAQNEERTLAPGNYGDVVLKMGGKLIFTGGVYNLRSLNCGDDTKLVFLAASEVRIAEKFETGQGSSIGPETGGAIGAGDIVFYIAGINGSNGNLGATPKAAKIGLSNTVFANFYVPNGTLWLRQGSVVEGAFIARDVNIGIGVRVSLNSAW